jgi:hypothetical protein
MLPLLLYVFCFTCSAGILPATIARYSYGGRERDARTTTTLPKITDVRYG